MPELTHFNEAGLPRMVDVGDKPKTIREAAAEGTVRLNRETFELAVSGTAKKGDVFAAAQIAGIMAAKRASDIIPMCHPVALTAADISYKLCHDECRIVITAVARCSGETGVEMEAMTAVSAAALTIYDMLKAAQRDIIIENIRLIRKSGGKSGDFTAKPL